MTSEGVCATGSNDKIPIPEWAAAFNQSKLATAKARVVNPNDLMLADKWPIVAERYMRFEPSVANDYLVYTTNCLDRPEQYNFASKLSPGASQLQYEFMTSVTDYETGLAVPKDYQAFKGFTSTQLKALMPAKWSDMVSKVNGMYLITPKSKISFNDFGLIITCDLVQMSKELGTEAKQ